MAKRVFFVFLFFFLIAAPLEGARALPSGVGVIGDSASEPYRCIGRGDGSSFTWTEILARVRGLNFGPGACQGYNHAGSGERIDPHMTIQTRELLADVRAGKIGRVIIMLGHNDFYSGVGAPDVPSLLAIYKTNVNRLIDAGIVPRHILIIDISQENQPGPQKALVEQFNAGLRQLVREKGLAFASVAGYQAGLACRSGDGGRTYNVGGQVIYNRFGDEWHNFRLADGHLGTLANGLLANALMADFLGFTRMSDAELLSVVNGQVVPSNPLPGCRTVLRAGAAQDGWVLESAENSNQGGALNTAGAAFFLGDDAHKKQYRAILSFTTRGLPDQAVITGVTLKLKKQGVAGGGNPIQAFQGLLVDLKKGYFGASAGLQGHDFESNANQIYGPFTPALKNGWYSFNLTPARGYINKLSRRGGVTQMRLRFKLDDDNNAVANYLKLYSGDAPDSSRPQLIIQYYIP